MLQAWRLRKHPSQRVALDILSASRARDASTGECSKGRRQGWRAISRPSTDGSGRQACRQVSTQQGPYLDPVGGSPVQSHDQQAWMISSRHAIKEQTSHLDTLMRPVLYEGKYLEKHQAIVHGFDPVLSKVTDKWSKDAADALDQLETQTKMKDEYDKIKQNNELMSTLKPTAK
ncbi:unnamed protein product [Prorocentrum cordatum]|uniref:ATP synthase subunit d, mitochondrial n=1 Tax=Prorocentrum cordatum TaxID=2364126 RepID=A0ABN9TAQ6_9DINO|nr:unnamed protein product [Polarella glacialis]